MNKTDNFIKKSKVKHGNKYDYSLVKYENNSTKVDIICKEHGEFLKSPGHHLRGQGCPSCSNRKRVNTESFIERCNKIHNKFYKYTLVDYKNQDTNVKITCPQHGEFEQRPDHHLAGVGCKFCSYDNKKNNLQDIEYYKSVFIEKSNKKWNNKFDYYKVNYNTARKKVIIICPEHGEFEQSPDAHLKHDCLKCTTKNTADNQRYTTSEFIMKSINIHGNKYDYSKVNYKNNKEKVEIICKKHGSWWQAPYNHLSERGCRFCFSRSKGEIKVENFLIENKINFSTEKTFNDCKNPKTNTKLRFDFYLIDKNICIEYDGQQHFKAVDMWGGEPALKKSKKRDKIKDEYCKNNNIHLLRISYKENIFDKLKNLLIL